MDWKIVGAVAAFSCALSGCVTQAVLKDTLQKLEESQKRTAKVAVELEAFKRLAGDEIQNLKLEQGRLGRALVRARDSASDAQTNLESSQYHLTTERQTLEQAQTELEELERDRQVLGTRVDVLAAQLEAAHNKLGLEKEAIGRALGHIDILEREHARLTQELSVAQTNVAQSRVAFEEVLRERNTLRSKVEELRGSLAVAHKRIAKLQKAKRRTVSALTKARNRAEALESLLATERQSWQRLEKTLTTVGQHIEPSEK